MKRIEKKDRLIDHVTLKYLKKVRYSSVIKLFNSNANNHEKGYLRG